MAGLAITTLHLIKEDWRFCFIYLALSVVINLDTELSAINQGLWFWFTIFYLLAFFYTYYLSFKFQRTMLKWNGFTVSPIPDFGLQRYLVRSIGLDFILILCILISGIVWFLISPETMNNAVFKEHRQTILTPTLVFLFALFATRFGNWITVTLLGNPQIVPFRWDIKAIRVFLSLLLLTTLSGFLVYLVKLFFPMTDPSIFWIYQMPLVTILGLVVKTMISILATAATSIIITQAYIDRVRELPDAPFASRP